ncbi:hypothetical protein CRG98_047309 [Punica granatum]|uniref:Uncharacterized protein n=1 Tax=Punica granatum TaxID=22663 RepID=A0A2I0HLE8_PUNGR|nr:hypothetical protein CRG98_047309 [Punica granatum]
MANRFLDMRAYSSLGFLIRIDCFAKFTVSKRVRTATRLSAPSSTAPRYQELAQARKRIESQSRDSSLECHAGPNAGEGTKGLPSQGLAHRRHFRPARTYVMLTRLPSAIDYRINV